MHYLATQRLRGRLAHRGARRGPATPTAGLAAAGSSVLSNAPSLGLETELGDLAVSLRAAARAEAVGDRLRRRLHVHLARLPAARAGGAAALHLPRRRRAGRRRARTCTSSGSAAGRPAARSASASLIGPGGAVAVHVDRQPHARRRGLPPAGRDRDRPTSRSSDDSLYTAQVTFTSDAGVRAVKRWSFRTGEISARGRGADRRGGPAATSAPASAAAGGPHAAARARAQARRAAAARG